jgi:TRAP-type C4-dicarboxylate transport system permease small subunit
MLVVLTYQVVLRFVFGSANSWSEEIARYWFIWVIFIATSYAAKEDVHIKIDFLTSFWPGNIKKYIVAIGLVTNIAFSIFIAYNGIFYAMNVHRQGQYGPGTSIPLWINFCAIPIGYGLMSARLLTRLRKSFSKKDTHEGEKS